MTDNLHNASETNGTEEVKPKPVLTRLRFKNWRSLRDVVIDDLQPINVFIGANSSGKTNIIDALRFYRDAQQKGLVSAVMELGYNKIQTDVLENDEDVELEFTYQLKKFSDLPITEITTLQFQKRDVPFKYGRALFEGDVLLRREVPRDLPIREGIETFSFTVTDRPPKHHHKAVAILNYLSTIAQKRWQILSENFMPPLRLSHQEGGDIYLMERDAQNTLVILNYMKQAYPELYTRLSEDLSWLLNHVVKFDVLQYHDYPRDIEAIIRENNSRIAPTISSGTARIVAMLTAIYALDMRQEINSSIDNLKLLTPEIPGLVIIEEPDTALNPGLLRKFVEQIRFYADGDNPRQFIFTTHNPLFLDYFKPEEVRVVSRDENGYTTVDRVPERVKENWLDEYGLGEVWTTNSFGGLAE